MISGPMRLSVTKMDSKGRISIPLALRHYMRLSQGDELMLKTESKELRLMPVGMGNTELNIKFKKSSNVSEALCNIMHVLSKNRIGVINSEVKMLGGYTGWRAVVDIGDYKNLRNEISELKEIKDVSIKKNIS